MSRGTDNLISRQSSNICFYRDIGRGGLESILQCKGVWMIGWPPMCQWIAKAQDVSRTHNEHDDDRRISRVPRLVSILWSVSVTGTVSLFTRRMRTVVTTSLGNLWWNDCWRSRKLIRLPHRCIESNLLQLLIVFHKSNNSLERGSNVYKNRRKLWSVRDLPVVYPGYGCPAM